MFLRVLIITVNLVVIKLAFSQDNLVLSESPSTGPGNKVVSKGLHISCPKSMKLLSCDGSKPCSGQTKCLEYDIEGKKEKCCLEKSKFTDHQSQIAIFEKPKKANLTITGKKISTHNVTSQLQCYDYCIRIERCQAFNYEYKNDGGKKNCQLYSKIKLHSNKTAILKYKENYTYEIVNHALFREVFLSENEACTSKKDSPLPTIQPTSKTTPSVETFTSTPKENEEDEEK